MSSDSFPVIPAGLLPTPGTCSKCGSNLRDCIDLGINVDYYGAVLLCVSCAGEFVNVDQLNLVTKHKFDEIKYQYDKLSHGFNDLNNALTGLRDGLLRDIDAFDSAVRGASFGTIPGTEIVDEEQSDLDSLYSRSVEAAKPRR